jgi:hypothetical protein
VLKLERCKNTLCHCHATGHTRKREGVEGGVMMEERGGRREEGGGRRYDRGERKGVKGRREG